MPYIGSRPGSGRLKNSECIWIISFISVAVWTCTDAHQLDNISWAVEVTPVFLIDESQIGRWRDVGCSLGATESILSVDGVYGLPFCPQAIDLRMVEIEGGIGRRGKEVTAVGAHGEVAASVSSEVKGT